MNIEYRDAFLIRNIANGKWLTSDYDPWFWADDRERANLFDTERDARFVFRAGMTCNFKDHEIVAASCGILSTNGPPVRVTKYFTAGEQPELVDWLADAKRESLREGYEIAREYHDSTVLSELRLGEAFMAIGKLVLP